MSSPLPVTCSEALRRLAIREEPQRLLGYIQTGLGNEFPGLSLHIDDSGQKLFLWV